MRKYSYIMALALSLLMVSNVYPMVAQTTKVHIVQDKETVYSIAKKYGITIHEVYALNPNAKEAIHVGEKLTLPAKTIAKDTIVYQTSKETNKPRPVSTQASTPVTQNPSGVTKHTIVKGETLYSVCKRYGVTEESVMVANPGITPHNFRIGDTIIIPLKKNAASASKPQVEEVKTTPITVTENRQLKIALLLPLNIGNPGKYMEFYEGFLMGVYEMKKHGISVDLLVQNLSKTSSLGDLSNTRVLENKDLVIGGISDAQIEGLARLTNKNGIYVVPFRSKDNIASLSGNLYQVNSPQENLYREVLDAFVAKYKGYNIIFANKGDSNVDAFAQYLKRGLDKLQMQYKEMDLTGLGQTTVLPAKTVVIPMDQSSGFALDLMKTIERFSSCEVFASPRWQSYNSSIIKSMHKHNTTIYSSFYFDKKSPMTQSLEKQYYSWFAHSMTSNYPKYGALGYDVARFFISAVSSYGKDFMKYLYQIPTDGIQTDFKFRKVSDDGNAGYINQNVFFITYKTDGSIKKVAI